MRETVSRVVDGKVVTMYKDELEKILIKIYILISDFSLEDEYA